MAEDGPTGLPGGSYREAGVTLACVVLTLVQGLQDKSEEGEQA
jgi:hypothetical protein